MTPYCEHPGCHDARTQVFRREGATATVDYDGEGSRLCWIHGMHEFGVVAGDDWTDPLAPRPMMTRRGLGVVRDRGRGTVTTSHDYPRRWVRFGRFLGVTDRGYSRQKMRESRSQTLSNSSDT